MLFRNYAKQTPGLFTRIIGKISAFTVLQYINYVNTESIEQYDERVTGEAEERLAAAKEFAEDLGVDCDTVLVKSFSPADAIIEQCDKHDCDLVFMASHGRKGIAAVLLGSETQKVLTHSKIPVMVYR